MVNQELLLDVLAQITHRPETHTQDQWSCGTAFCVGGWAIELGRPGRNWAMNGVISVGLRRQYGSASRAAKSLLGLSGGHNEHTGLFRASNTLDDIYEQSAVLLGVDEQVLRDKIQHREPPRP